MLSWAFLLAQPIKNLPQHRRSGFNPWVGEIPWSKKWQPIPVLCLENPMVRGAWQATVHVATKSQIWLSDVAQHTCTCCLQDMHLIPMDTYRLKVRGWEKVFLTNENHKKTGVAILKSEKNRLPAQYTVSLSKQYVHQNTFFKNSCKQKDTHWKNQNSYWSGVGIRSRTLW